MDDLQWTLPFKVDDLEIPPISGNLRMNRCKCQVSQCIVAASLNRPSFWVAKVAAIPGRVEIRHAEHVGHLGAPRDEIPTVPICHFHSYVQSSGVGKRPNYWGFSTSSELILVGDDILNSWVMSNPWNHDCSCFMKPFHLNMSFSGALGSLLGQLAAHAGTMQEPLHLTDLVCGDGQLPGQGCLRIGSSYHRSM